MDISGPLLAQGVRNVPLSREQRRLARALATLVGVIVSFLGVLMLCRWSGAQPSGAIVAALLAIGFAQRARPLRRLQLLIAPLAAVGVVVLAAAVGTLLRTNHVVGAAVFSAALGVSIWLRNFGERGRLVGALIALPLIGMLVVPARFAAPGGLTVDLALLVCAGLIPFACVGAIGWLVRRAGVTLVAEPFDAPERATSRARGGVPVPTRMALQMAVAIAAAFGLGFALFPLHWSWTVLTAFIVCSGARGRGDAAYTGILRLAGAVGGTLAAAALTAIWAPSGSAEATTIFVVLFLGLWLRDRSYAYWAGCMTLILALLSRTDHTVNVALLESRLAAILVGALCGVSAAWFVLPIRTEAVIRRRIADALLALDELIAHTHSNDSDGDRRIAHVEFRLHELARVAPPVRWHRRIMRFADHPDHPGRWVELVDRVHACADTFIEHGHASDAQRGAIRRAIGIARRAIGNHGKSDAPAGDSISTALEKLALVIARSTPARDGDESERGASAITPR